MDHEGHRQRLRDRALATGIEGLAPHEVLELLLTFAIPRRDVKPLAYELLNRFGHFNRVLEAGPEELKQVPGIGDQAAVLISMLLPVFRLYQQGSFKGKTLKDPEDLKNYCRSLLYGEKYERFLVLALDEKGRLIHTAEIASGDEGETAVYPRLVVSALLNCGARAAIMVHNHPSGNPAPSQADRALIKALEDLLRPLGIRLQDGLIVAGESVFGFRENGLITG